MGLWWWILVVRTIIGSVVLFLIGFVVAVGFLVLGTLVVVAPLVVAIKILVYTLVPISPILKTGTTDEVYVLLVTIIVADLYMLHIFCKANLLLRSLVTLSNLALTSSICSFPKPVANFFL